MFNHKETMYFVIFEILLSSFSVYQLTVAILTKAKEIEHNQIEVKFERIETFKRIESDVKEIRVEIEEKSKIIETKTEEPSKVIQRKQKEKIKNQIISIEEDDADIIWFNEN